LGVHTDGGVFTLVPAAFDMSTGGKLWNIEAASLDFHQGGWSLGSASSAPFRLAYHR
jgi:hypothetical protein